MTEITEKQYSILMTTTLAQMTFTGDKTQTRRPLRTLPGEDFCDFNGYGDPVFTADEKKYRIVKNRYGNVGASVAVKELYFAYGNWKKDGLTKTGKPKMRFVDLTAQQFAVTNGEYRYANAGQDDVNPLRKGMTRDVGWYKRPSLYMPRRAARSVVEILELRVERVQDISEADARAEGMVTRRPRLRFQKLWDDINKERGFGWDLNPWVLAITYKKKNGQGK